MRQWVNGKSRDGGGCISPCLAPIQGTLYLYIMYIFISCRLNSDFKTQAGFPTMLLSFLEETNSVSFVCMYYIVLFSDVHLECVAECNYGS